MVNKLSIAFAAAVLTASAGVGFAQFGRPAGGVYTSSRMNPQRTSAMEYDVFINPEAVAGKEFRLQWTWKPAGAPHVPEVAGVTMQSGLFKPLSMVSFGPGFFAAIDNETGVEYWTHTVSSSAPKACQSTSAIARGSAASVPPIPPYHPNPSSGPFVSAVGNPGEGYPAEMMASMSGPSQEYMRAAAAARAAGQPLPPAPAAAPRPAMGDAQAAGGTTRARGAGAAAPFRFNTPQGFYVVTADGVLHNFGQNAAKDLVQPKPFLNAGAKVSDLIVVNNIAYATVSGDCGGVEPGIYSIGTAATSAAPAASLKLGGDVIGGPAFTSDGAMFGVVGEGKGQYAGSVLAMDPKTLSVKDSFSIPAGPGSAVMVSKIGEKEFVVVAGKDGRIYILDPNTLGGTDHKTPLYVWEDATKGKPAGSATLFGWTDASGTWIGEAGSAGVTVLKAGGSPEHPVLSQAWTSAQISARTSPTVIGGVIFGAGPEKTKLVALDGASGKLLWNSGNTIAAPINSQPWYSLGQVYVSGSDSTVYAFGMPMERY